MTCDTVLERTTVKMVNYLLARVYHILIFPWAKAVPLPGFLLLPFGKFSHGSSPHVFIAQAI